MSIEDRYKKWKQNKQKEPTSQSGSFGSRYTAWKMKNDGAGVADGIASRVNTWLKNNDNYVSNYQKRFSGRTGTYKDVYVNDSADYYSTVLGQKQRFDTEAENIRSLLGRYGDYLDADWVNDVLSALDTGGKYQSEIVSAAKRDGDFWSQFGGVGDYQAWQSAMRISGYQEKYDGKSYEEILSAINELEDGEEKEWLDSQKYEYVKSSADFDKISSAGWESYLSDAEKARQPDPEEKWYEKLGRYLGTSPDTSLPMGTTSQVVNDLRNDTSYMKPSGSWTDEQKGIYGYLYSKSKNAAREYARYTNESNNKVSREEKTAAIEKWATKNGFNSAVATLASVAMMPLSLTDTLSALAEYNARGFVSTSATPLPGEVSNTITSAIASMLNEKSGTLNENIPVIGGKGMGDAYQIGTSIANSMLSAYTQGAVGTYMVFFGSASASGMYEAKERGATDEQALTLGVLNGLAEAAGEAFSVDKLLGRVGVTELKGFFSNVLMQAGIEASEEGVTTLLNNFSDRLVMGDKSNFNVLVSYYMSEEKLSEEEAKKKAWKSMANDLAFDMLSGAVSGGVSSGVQTGVQTAIRNNAAKELYGNGEGIVTKALEIDPNNAYAQKLKTRVDGKKSLTGGQINRLLEQNESAIFKNDVRTIADAAESRLTELGENGDVSAVAAALAKQASGEKLTRAERQAIENSKFGQRVANELNPEKIRSEQYSSAWAERIGTDRINAEEYSRLLQDMETESATDLGEAIGNFSRDESYDVERKTGEAETKTAAEAEKTASTAENAAVLALESAESAAETDEADETARSELEIASERYGAQAKAMVATYHNGQDVTEFDHAYYAAYEMGKSGVPLSYAKNSAETAYLTEKQRELAYEAGLAASAGTAASQAELVSSDKKITAPREGTVRAQDLTLDEIRSTFNDRQNTAYKLLATYAKATGINIVLYRSEANESGEFAGAQGKFVRDENTVYIDINAGLLKESDVAQLGKYTMMRTFAHEFTHFIEKWNPVRYNEFRRFVFDTMTERGENVHDLIERRQAEGDGLDYDAASREVIAEAMTDILPDANFVTELCEKHKTIFDKLLSQLKAFVDKLKKHFAEMGSNRFAGANVLKEQMDGTVRYLESVVKLFDNVALEAVENYQAAAAVEETVDSAEADAANVQETSKDARYDSAGGTGEGEAQEQSRSYLSAEAEPQKYSYEWFAAKPDMAVTTVNNQVPDNRADVVRQAKENAAKIGKTNPTDGSVSIYVDDVGAYVLLGTDGLKHGLRRTKDAANDVNYIVTLKAGEIIKNSIRVNEATPKKQNATASYVLIGAAKNTKGDMYIVRSIVNEFNNELNSMDVLYAINAKKELAATKSPRSAEKPLSVTSSNISIAELIDIVKNYYPDILPESVLRHYGYDARPEGDLGPDVLYQQRSAALTDSEVLELASTVLNSEELSEAERDALGIFNKRLSKLRELEKKRMKLGKLYRKEQSAGREYDKLATETLNRIRVLDGQIAKASKAVLSLKDKAILKRVLSKARQLVETKEREHGRQVLSDWRRQRLEALDREKYLRMIRSDANSLSRWILRPDRNDVTHHVSDVLKPTLIPFLKSIDDSSRTRLAAARKGEEKSTKKDDDYLERLKALERVMTQYVTGNKEGVTVDKLFGDYDLPDGFLDGMRSRIENAEKLIKSAGQDGFVLQKMDSHELRKLSAMIRTLKTSIIGMNRMLANESFRTVEEAGKSTIEELLTYGSDKGKTGKVKELLYWKQMRPAHVFERFGEGGVAIFNGLAAGQDRLSFNSQKIIDFAKKTFTGKECSEWEESAKTVKLESGEEITLTAAQSMSLYLLSKREKAQDHLYTGGIRPATQTVEGENGKKFKNEIVNLKVTKADVEKICKTLSKRQIEVADKLQRFMAEQGGEWGNYVTVKRFGEAQFGEKDYFPMNVDGNHLRAKADDAPASLYALLNMGFTHQVTDNASNGLMLYSVFEVFAKHMASVAQYNALALPVLDAVRWLNYTEFEKNKDGSYVRRERDKDTGELTTEYVDKDTGEKKPRQTGALVPAHMRSVREQMKRVYGSPQADSGGEKQSYAEHFVLGILKAFNGTEAQGAPGDAEWMKLLSKYNRAAVSWNARVVIQQPTAIARAGAVLGYDTILKGIAELSKTGKKSIGEMRAHSGIAVWKSLGFYDVNISRGLTDLIKQNDSRLDKFVEWGMKGAEGMDTLTWAAIWNACKEDVKAKKKGLKVGSKEYFDAVTSLFNDVIYQTQVVDSILTKSEHMRGKGLGAKMTSSFMSEPVTAASMVLAEAERFERDLKRGAKFSDVWKKRGRSIGRLVYVYCLTSALNAAVASVSDAWRDDDDYMTFVEKWWAAFSGIDRKNGTVWQSFLDSLDGGLAGELNLVSKIPGVADLLEASFAILIPVSNAVLGTDFYSGDVQQTALGQIATLGTKAAEIIIEKLTGDTNYTWYAGVYKGLQVVSGGFGIPIATLTREVVSAWNAIIGDMAPSLKIKNYDPGEKASIKYAYSDGYLTDGEAKALLFDGGLAEDENDVYFTLKLWRTGESKFGPLYEALIVGADIEDHVSELTSHGYTEKEVTAAITGKVREWYVDEESETRVTKQHATKLLEEYTDKTDDEIDALITKWTCKVVTGIEYTGIKDEFLAGNITASRAKQMYKLYGGLTDGEASSKVALYSFIKANPALGDISETAVANYNEYCKGADVKPKVYYDAWKHKNSLEGEGKKESVLEYIDGLTLSRAQKDSLYYALGYKESTIGDAPWR